MIRAKTAIIVASGLVLAAGGVYLTMSHLYAQDGSMHGHGHGMHMHDEATMPGLRGANASEEESAEIAILFRNFATISREVEELPNGIRTVTRSSDPEVMEALIRHSVGMIDRVGQLNDPEIIIQSPTLDIFFLRGEEIESFVEVTEEGLVVVQTSESPDLVDALHTHAAEVSAMADRGMQAVHEMMEERAQSN